MKLYPDVWIEGGYYVDFDELGQLRVIGPNNHLYCGLVDIPRHSIALKKVVSTEDDSLHIQGAFKTKNLRLYLPLMGDMRSIRKKIGQDPQFLSMRKHYPDLFLPQEFKIQRTKVGNVLTFRRNYDQHLYQTVWIFPSNVQIRPIETPLKGVEIISSNSSIPFSLIADTDDIQKLQISDTFITHPTDFNWSVFGRLAPLVKRELSLTQKEIEHMLTWKKTSGDRFGTVFPRDWMESADIGLHDLTAEARMLMYSEALAHVNPKGEAWHEDVVGELRSVFQHAGKDLYDRKMVDLEPHLIMGLEKLPDDFLLDKLTLQNIQRVAALVIQKARQRKPITFKKKTANQYYLSGNWRDSGWAYKQLSPVVAPFDVNAVFYPKALQVLHNKEHLLNLKAKDLHSILDDWMEVKEQYRFTNPDGRSAFGLALLDTTAKWSDKKKRRLLDVNHLDESYYFTYLDGTAQEVGSFVDRLLDPNYFYTPSGPVLVAKNNTYGYTSEEYHGEVIWTKQVAYTLLGLSKHLKTAVIQEWPLPLKRKIKQAIIKTSENMIRVYDRLGYIPEVHLDMNGKPALPNDPEGVSRVQLWSAVGARRIFRKYHDMKTDLRYKFHD